MMSPPKKIKIAKDDEEIVLNEREQKIYEAGVNKGWETCGLIFMGILMAIALLIHIFT